MSDNRPSLRVLHVGQKATRRGAETVMAHLSLGLMDRGHVISAAFPSKGPVSEMLSDNGIPVHYWKNYDSDNIFSILRNLCRIVTACKADILHTHDGLTNLMGRICRVRFPFLSIVSSIHGLRNRYAVWSYNPGHSPLRAKRLVEIKLYHIVERCTRPWCDKFVAHSEAIAAELMRDGVPRNKIVTLRHGLPDCWMTTPSLNSGMLRKLLPESTASALLIGLIGVIEPGKGQHILLEAIPRILEQYRNVSFVFIGRTDEAAFYAYLRNRVVQLNISHYVQFVGELPEMASVYVDLDIVVQASYTEGLPLVVMEAMSMGKPIVATNVGGTTELIKDQETGMLVAPGDIGALADAIAHLLASSEKRKKLSVAACSYAQETFMMTSVVKKLETVYQDIAEATLQRRAKY